MTIRSAARAGAQRAAGRPSSSAGRVDIARSKAIKLDLAGVDEAQAGGQHGLEPDRAGGGFGEGQALGLDVLRIVVGHR